MPKADSAVVSQRITQLLDLILHGAKWPSIVQFAADSDWGIHERQLRTYLQRAYVLLEEQHEEDRQRLLRIHVARRELLWAKALEQNDLANARATLKDLAELQGLYADDRIEQRLAELETMLATIAARKDDNHAN